MPQSRFILDTNIASFIIRGASPLLKERLSSVPLARLMISVLTEAELRFVVAQAPHTRKLAPLVDSFLSHVTILPWESAAAMEYALLRLALTRKGLTLANMDLLIAAHALAARATLVTNDAALLRSRPLVKATDWTT